MSSGSSKLKLLNRGERGGGGERGKKEKKKRKRLFCNPRNLFYLFEELNAGLEVHTKVYKYPVYALSMILFLLQHEHVMVEELLQLFVTEVDTKLFEAIVLSRVFRGVQIEVSYGNISNLFR